MTRSLGFGVRLTLVALLAAGFAKAQGTGGSGSGTSGTRTTTPTTQPRTTRPSTRTVEPFRGPTFISGRVLSELARPLSEPVSVELNCGMRSLQVIHTDLGGYFTFNLGTGAQSNIDFSASNETPQSFTSNTAGLPSRFGNPLAGCEIRISVAGFRPRNFPLAHLSEMGRLDIGNVMLDRIAGTKGAAVSVTSLLVPKEASKEFEKAVKELEKNKPDAALPHLEKAVQIYDRYAAAWNEIGRIQLNRSEREKAAEAFARAIAADSEYLPPLMHLATLQIQNREWEKGVETAGKALELDPDLGFANFLKAVGEYNLNHLEEAERSAQAAEKSPHEGNPQVHALLAQIYMGRQEYAQAAVHIRSYLEESPSGEFADKMRKDLADIEDWLAADDASTVPAPPEPGS
jgi:hypothetical protein